MVAFTDRQAAKMVADLEKLMRGAKDLRTYNTIRTMLLTIKKNNDMTIYTTGKVFEKGPITAGVSQSGNTWQRMTLVIDVQVGQYSKKMALQVMTGNVPAVMAFNTGDKVEVGWDISSREYTNKDGVRTWFTQAELRSIKAAETVVTTPIPEAGPAQEDDLPFN